MPKKFDVSKFENLLKEARNAFLADSAYAIAIARPAGALASRRREKAEFDDPGLPSV